MLGLLGDGECVEDIQMAIPRLQALIGQTGIREAHEVVHAAAGASVAGADQSVAAHAPSIARTSTSLPGTL